jgi:hypothetical protein
MHLPSQAALDPPPRRFVSPASAAPTAPPGPACLASPGGGLVSPRPRRTPTIGFHPPSTKGPGAEDDADRDVRCCLALSGLGVSPRPARGERPRPTSLALLLSDPSTRPAPIRAVDPCVAAENLDIARENVLDRAPTLGSDAGEAPGVPAGRGRRGHATA